METAFIRIQKANLNLTNRQTFEILKIMKQYACDIAEHTLKDAAANHGHGGFSCYEDLELSQNQITSTKIETP